MNFNTTLRPLRIGLLGETLAHSFSPPIHRALVGDAYTYELFERAPGDVESFLKSGDWDALNVTIPYKKTVMPYLDVISDEARRIGAVNTITRLSDGRLRGDNTDYFGFERTLRACGVDVSEKKALVLGNGGAAATAVQVLRDSGAWVVVLAKSDRSVGGVSPECYETMYDRHADAEVVVNCTPVGMYPRYVGEKLVELSLLPRASAVLDMVYNPARTALLQEADTHGIPAYNGLLMLVAQAKRAAELFLGTELDDSLIDRTVAAIARQTENIVLVGMPGCGKSTIAARLSVALDRPSVDTDAMVVETAGRSIPEIFASDGETAFRLLETEAVRRAGMQSGTIIATGGGVVTQARNLPPLAQNGRIVFLKRDLHRLPTAGRPLSQRNSLAEMYARRLPLYEAFADVVIDNNGTPDETVRSIMQALGYENQPSTERK